MNESGLARVVEFVEPILAVYYEDVGVMNMRMILTNNCEATSENLSIFL